MSENDEIEPGDPLSRAMLELRRPVPIAPGLAARAGARGRRHRRQRLTLATVAASLVVAITVINLVIPRRAQGRTITFALVAPSVRSVSLVGDFTDWRPDRVRLQRASTGVWHATVTLRPGQYRFAYLVDNAEWRADTREATAPDDFGRPTSVVTVREN